MKKKYLYGIIAGIIAILVATFLFVWLGMKCSLSVSANQGYTVTVKDIELDDKGTANVRKGEDLVFAVVLEPNYSDSNVKVMANDTEITGKQGVYRYTVEEDTTITIEGVTENDYITQGVDVDPGTLDGEGYILLRDENKRPIPVLADISMNSVDRLDIPNLDLTASVLESVNPGWKFRDLTAVNLGKYAAAKFYVKHSNYLEAKFSFGEKFYERGGNDTWHEFAFQNDEGMMTLYVDGEKIGSCNYLSDIQFCLQDKGSYKFSHIYVIPKDDYQGGMLSVEEGEGYQVDIPAREYAIGATLQFHVNIDEGFMKGSNFTVKAGNQVLEAREDGSYTFVFNGNTTIRVSGVVPKPLDSRYQVVGTPMRAEWEETGNYILVQGVADSKTYTHTQAQWGSVPFAELELKQYSNLLFFMKKDDTDPKKWVEILQKADDGTVTPYLQKNDNIWHKIEIKKEGGQMYFYLDGERNATPIIDTEHLSFVMNEGLELRITSLLGIVDPNYVPPEPDYISSAYEVIGTPMAIEGKEVENYILVSRTEDAKTYEHTPPGWRGFNMVEMDFAPYKSLLFFVHKEDVNTKTYLEVLKGDPNQIPHEADYVATNANKWHKIELVKNAQGTLDVYVNDEKHDVTIANTKDLMITISANATLTYTSLFGIADPAYVPPEPDYIGEEYVTITSSLATTGEEIENYVLVSKTEDAKTYQITPPGWRGLHMTEVDMAPYESLLFFVHKEDVNSKTYLEVLKGDPNQIPHEADYVSTNDNKWYKIELVKNAQGALDVYVNDVKHGVSIASTEDLIITISANATLMYTSVFGKADPNYVPPTPDYIDSEYKTITSSLMVDGEEIENYVLVSKTEDAKTYQITPPGWRGLHMTEVDMAPYESLLFFVHKEDVNSKTYLEVLKGDPNHIPHEADYVSTNDNKWYKIELVKNNAGELDVYVNDVKHDVSIASVKDLTITISANATLMYTSVFGKADPNYVPPTPDYIDSEYKTITSSLMVDGEEIENYVLVSKTEDAKTYQITPPGWRGLHMTEVDMAPYESLLFFVHKEDVNSKTYLEVLKGDPNHIPHEADYVSTNDNKWYKIELVKNAQGTLDVYVNDVKHDVAISSVKDLTFTISGGATLMYTSVFGKADPNYVEPEPVVEDVMVVISPWAYGYGSMDNSQTYTEGGYEYVTLVSGSGTAYKGALMKDVQLSDYQEIRFAVKTNGSYYYEGGRVANSEWSMMAGANTTWREWSFKYEADGSGNMGYRLYRDGSAFGEYFLPEDTNLSDLQMKFSSNTAGILYMTEVRGTLKEGVESALKVVAPSFNTYEGEATDSERPIQFATSSMKVATSWSGTKSPLADIALDGYSKIIFYARQFEGSGYFESDYLGTMQMKDAWVEFKLVKNADKTWNLYCGGILKTENVTLDNLNDVNATYGDGNYYFSQVFGVEEETQGPTPEIPVETIVVTSPWAYHKGTMDTNQTYTEGGYECATLVSGSSATYAGALMKDVEFSSFQELRFAVKTTSGHYYEVGKVSENNYSLFSGAPTSWREYIFRYENDGAGTEGYRLYRKNYGENESDQNVLLPADTNLSDLQMKFSNNTSGILYMTELRGTLKEGASLSLEVLADSFNEKTGTEVTTEKPNMVATKSTEAVTSHSYTQNPLTNVNLSSYDKILFYARKAGSDEKTGWFESVQLGSFVIEYNWTEFKLVKNDDGTWNIWTGGVLKASNQTLTNLSNITATYGINHYYFSEVFGVPTADNRPILSGEYMVVTSPWAYNKGAMDSSQTYTEGGYEYATLVPGSSKAYEGALMKDVEFSSFQELRFAVKTTSGHYYEAGKVSENNYSLFSGAPTSWREYIFRYENDGAGTEGYRLYRKNYGENESDQNVLLPADTNLSDLQMKFSSNTSGILYMTELRGIAKEGARLSLEVLADSFNEKTGTEVTTEKPNLAATKSTEAVTSHSYTQNPLTNVDLSSYEKILFYARKAGSDEKTGWFESVQLGSFVIEYNWTEFKLVKNADGTWNVWTGGVLKQSNQTLTNLSDLTATYGINHYYFSEVFGVLADK